MRNLKKRSIIMSVVILLASSSLYYSCSKNDEEYVIKDEVPTNQLKSIMKDSTHPAPDDDPPVRPEPDPGPRDTSEPPIIIPPLPPSGPVGPGLHR